MTIYELFEQHYANQHGIELVYVAMMRMSSGSYAEAKIATAFRMFKAGFDANQTENMQVLGYMTHKGVLNALSRKGAFFAENQTDAKCVPVFINERNAPKTGE